MSNGLFSSAGTISAIDASEAGSAGLANGGIHSQWLGK